MRRSCATCIGVVKPPDAFEINHSSFRGTRLIRKGCGPTTAIAVRGVHDGWSRCWIEEINLGEKRKHSSGYTASRSNLQEPYAVMERASFCPCLDAPSHYISLKRCQRLIGRRPKDYRYIDMLFSRHPFPTSKTEVCCRLRVNCIVFLSNYGRSRIDLVSQTSRSPPCV